MRRRLNRHAQRRLHKRELEKKFTRSYYSGSEGYNVDILRQRLQDEAKDELPCRVRNGGWEYWKSSDMSKMRQFAKKYSDKRIRQKYRRMIHHMDHDDVPAPHGSDYEKEYDYNWMIW